MGLAWDDPLPDDLQEEFLRWVADLRLLTDSKVPHPLYVRDWFTEGIQLHMYANTSPKAYGCCAYLRFPDFASSLVTSSAHVAPLKCLMLP